MKARLAAVALAISVGGVALIKGHEGLVQRSYVDPVGVVTACYGHTATARLGQTFSREACDALLRQDLKVAEAAVRRHVKVPIAQPTYDALVSFTFNVGEGNLRSSTLLRKLNAGDIRGACLELDRWVYAKGRKLPGLVTRRADERNLCLKGA